MVTRLYIPWKRLFKDLWFSVLIITIYMLFLSILDDEHMLSNLSLPLGIITVPGTAISLLLAFRTNSSYQRWWEARMVWGAIVNDSRSWVRQLMTFSSSDPKAKVMIVEMAYRQCAWCYALTRHLRKQDPTRDISSLINKSELSALQKSKNVPNALLYSNAKLLKQMHKLDYIDSYQLIQLDQTLTNLTDSMGKCERIKNTVFPSMYTLLLEILIYLFIFSVPYGLVETNGLVLLVTSLTLAMAFLVIERIATYLQDPFENTSSDTPMLTLSRTIEINIKDELGNVELPEPLKPIRPHVIM
ncbi:bestrophin family protein [Flammeovirga kamogawensis]|uniref:Bestrophin n=1 Tax=Flammeovirga kamogawensis TaxID=373891 RepID=A0ABX8GVG2_9BACT|nr:bestrophin family ion channel [Flammeovirga kamogawensis]MBB6461003.1 putative membrane protein [Flammeovirga kamogawensis]QWG07575.1 hypothetical protein KM029_01155 [Flammeovirga kamogawensis]TRX69387.1 hypothetical protein EO216_15095 [Flammeovirga kamogawensis]